MLIRAKKSKKPPADRLQEARLAADDFRIEDAVLMAGSIKAQLGEEE